MSTVLIVNSSARANSNTRFLSAKVAEGAIKAGHTVKTLEIGKAPIHPCVGCDVCRSKTPGKCAFNDIMTEFYPEVIKADIILFASPIYYFTVNAQAKLFMDRTYALGMDALKGKSIGGVFVYADTDPVKSGCINAIRMFQDICAFISGEWVGSVYGAAWEQGEIQKKPDVLQAALEFGASL